MIVFVVNAIGSQNIMSLVLFHLSVACNTNDDSIIRGHLQAFMGTQSAYKNFGDRNMLLWGTFLPGLLILWYWYCYQ